jgi:thiol-disulfide isomerase/thioredoxin
MVTLHAALAALTLCGAGQTVLLDFYADWCGPCRAMNPTVDALLAQGYHIERVNIDQNRQLAAQHRVQNIPCFVMLVDGREVDRVVGGTSFSRLERMCQMGASASAAPPRVENAAANVPNNNSAVAIPPTPEIKMPEKPFSQHVAADNFAGEMKQPSPTVVPTDAAPSPAEAALIAASVRLRIEDPGGRSCGSGTIIDARDGEALILTCSHIFRDSQGKGRIEVDLFGPDGAQQLPGRLIWPKSEAAWRDPNFVDVGLVAIKTPCPVQGVRVAPPGYRIHQGDPVVSVGCNNGGNPTALRSKVAALDKFLGPPNIQVAGQPVEGRSGGGLFSAEGYLIGVCNAADPSDHEGLFAALGAICAELDKADLSFVYKSPAGVIGAPTESPRERMLAAAPPPRSAPSSASINPASWGTPPLPATAPLANLSSDEQAALDEIRRRRREGAEVVCIIRRRGDADGRSEILMLENASPEFLRRLAAEADNRAADRPRLTSLEEARPRTKLLEWTAPPKG